MAFAPLVDDRGHGAGVFGLRARIPSGEMRKGAALASSALMIQE
jgi:hypothetical protein